ncbi:MULTISPECIES: acyltransferase family protein [Mycobacteriaceae]|uniref:Acyltransferase n=1 Tax=Mycolicibacterium neoaurum VKM Ac-1815D TaxID=700508 RepID=V5XHL5_MYCNE|nr:MULTISPECIES: acyltransferase [Mycobacteriaceae]AHC26894.1 acyltransferase [Mycolicibacterium neoaurum VKM Ac-1815D]AMO07183.1 acyltransferase [Mycolicibacterium neoaurum]AXK74439.1 acyltransferase [Mycolicibacterium neoaurum]KJQ50101.1 acyltransferase [Mycolicibacterium neoaurum]KUM07050.1 acyltransferase [Mycolicibacterium neoaurum]
MPVSAFPSVDDVAAATPAGRDRALDVIRITALLGVIAGHTVMATSIIRDDVFVWENLLTTSVMFQALTWIFQIMPLFFFAGVAASAGSYAGNWGGWLLKRCTRLYRPVFSYLAFWAVALAIGQRVLPTHVYQPIAGISIQLLWFLGAYVLVLAAVPLLRAITTVGRMTGGVVVIYTLIATIDAIRVNDPGWATLGYLNLAVWLIPGIFGVAYCNRLLTVSQAALLGCAMLAANMTLLRFGPYELSLVGIEGQELKNMMPPSLLLAGHAIMMCAFAIAAAPAIGRWARRPRVWWLTAIGNSGAMTLYLWHIPALLAVHLAFDIAGFPRYPGQPHFLALSIAQVLIMGALVAVLFVALRPLENNPLPFWDGGVVSADRSVAVGILLCVAGAATLASCVWGLKDLGLYCVAAVLVALAAARALT